MKPKLLVVDDEENLRELYRLELEDEGYEVHIAANARDAIKMLSDAKYDVIILDIQMPGMTGLEVARHLPDDGAVAARRGAGRAPLQALEDAGALPLPCHAMPRGIVRRRLGLSLFEFLPERAEVAAGAE